MSPFLSNPDFKATAYLGSAFSSTSHLIIRHEIRLTSYTICLLIITPGAYNQTWPTVLWGRSPHRQVFHVLRLPGNPARLSDETSRLRTTELRSRAKPASQGEPVVMSTAAALSPTLRSRIEQVAGRIRMMRLLRGI